MSMTDHGATLPEPNRPLSEKCGHRVWTEHMVRAAIEAERERCKAIAQDAAIRYSNGHIVNWDDEFRASSKAEGGMG